MDAASRIVDVDEVPGDGSVLFTASDGDERVEVVVVRLGDGVVAYENYCKHWTDVPLDPGSGASLRNGEILCERHGAYFELDSGYCTFGPCEGAVLDEIDVTVDDGAVYLTDERFSFDHLGGTDQDDRSSGSRIGFSGN